MNMYKHDSECVKMCHCHSGQKRYPVVGTKHFQNKDHYLDYISQVGQHPMHCTPCLNPERIDWSHPLVYEQWVKHHETTGNLMVC